MAKWIYTCKCGKELRSLIDRAGTWEMSIEILKHLTKCYDEIIENYPWEDEYDRLDFQEAREILEGDDDIIYEWMNGGDDVSVYGFEDDEELVDERLREFYDLCDSYRIWVEV